MFPEHFGIAHRPPEVAGRQVAGHWEGDLMIFGLELGKANLTSLIERKSRYTVIVKNSDRRSSPVISGIMGALAHLPPSLRQTMTFDRGFEFTGHSALRRDLGLQAYFCDPQSPWQKGSVESNNARIRRFFPRSTQLDTVSAADIYDVCGRLNGTPRKCLGYRTPEDVFREAMQEAT